MPDEELTLILKLRDEATAQMKKAQDGIGGSLKKIAKVAAVAAVAIGAAVGAAGVKLFKLASDAEEADNVIGLAFGSMKQQAIDWSVAFAAATGSSKFESRELAADLGLIIRGMGFTEEATLGMSTQMVELAADMSSAKNVPLAEALDKIRAGLIGESEPLRTMGVLLSAARVEQEAYASGIAATGSELSVQQKVQARMNIILADSVAMHGDLINTQDSAANQWRAIQNTVKDTATTLGQFFMPVFVTVLGLIRDGVTIGIEFAKQLYESSQESNRWTKALGNVKGILGVVWQVLKPLVKLLKDGLGWVIQKVIIPVIQDMVDNFNDLIENLEGGYNWIARLVPGLDEVAFTAKVRFTPAVKKAADSAEDFGVEVQEATRPTEDLGVKVSDLSDDFKDLVSKLRGDGAIKSAELWEKAVKDVGGVTKLTTKGQQALNTVLQTARDHFESMGDVVPPYIFNLQAASSAQHEHNELTRVAGGLSGELEAAFGRNVLTLHEHNVLMQQSGGLTDQLGEAFTRVLPRLERLNTTSKRTAREIYATFAGKLQETGTAFANLATVAGERFGAIGRSIGTAVTTLNTIVSLASTIQSAWSGIAGFFSRLFGTASSAAATIGPAMTTSIATVSSASISGGAAVTTGFFNPVMAGLTAASIGIGLLIGSFRSANSLANEFYGNIMRLPQDVRNRVSGAVHQQIIGTGPYGTGSTEYEGERQHGGPVTSGRPYVVGEAGPEIFVPGSSGSVASNKSLPTAEEIGAAVARALQMAPLVVPQDPVTDALYRNGPRRAALKGYA